MCFTINDVVTNIIVFCSLLGIQSYPMTHVLPYMGSKLVVFLTIPTGVYLYFSTHNALLFEFVVVLPEYYQSYSIKDLFF